MKYKPETIKTFIVNAKNAVLEMKNESNLKVSISKGNVKIGKVMNVSTMPILCCGNCAHCAEYCYDIKACYRYAGTMKARAKNTVLAMYHRKEFFAQIDNALYHRRNNKYFRWHVAGDILDYEYFEAMIAIAKKHPDFKFWTYTKMYSIVNRWIKLNGELPENFKCMFSRWEGVKMDNPFKQPEFRVRLEGMPETEFKHLHKCPGNCDICKLGNGRGCIGGETSYVDEH